MQAVTARRMSVKEAGDTSPPTWRRPCRNYVVNSGDRDRTEQLSDSETPYSVSSRTRSKMKSSGRVRHGATEYCDEDTGCRDGNGNTEHPTAKGDRDTAL